MRKFRVIAGMTALIVFFHILYFNLGSSKTAIKITARANDHVKITELSFHNDYPEGMPGRYSKRAGNRLSGVTSDNR
ncbi:MAG TPA: hypothetical protein VLZ28_06105 [Daejeonella sp.]|nr:hypothetical protein [Daejeonella sp.]